MQRIRIKSNEFENWCSNRNDRDYIVNTIYDEENKKIKLNGVNNNLINDQTENRKIDSIVQKFVKRYIDIKWIKYCPYCWKNYIAYFCNDIDFYLWNDWNDRSCEDFISWFDIEHFFPKGYVDREWNKPYAQLAKNLYNWHLSCLICNQRLKKDKDVLYRAQERDGIFNPYFWWIYKDWDEIKVDDSTFDDKVTFVWEPDPRFDNRRQVFKTYHWKFFRLWEIYLNDEETYNIFNFIYDKYTKIKDEYHRFKKTSKTIEEFVEYFFKNYYPKKEEDILKYSNWKFKKDLIEYMKKILEKIEENWRSNGN